MIEGHGDDAYKYKAIKINFSSNVYNHVDHSGLHQHLFQQMESIRTSVSYTHLTLPTTERV